MTTGEFGVPSGTPTAGAPRFIATFVVIGLTVAFLFGIDSWLARIDRRESAANAASLYSDGVALLARGDARGATDRFGAALEIERARSDYQLALAEAMLEDHRVLDAEVTLRELLTRAESDGAVNEVMARVLAREGRDEEAKVYYHRAIYGRWRSDTVENRRRTRFELIDLLARRHDHQELVAELLAFQDSPPDSVALRRRVASLFIVAGSPARGAAMFRELLRRDPDDAEAHRGLAAASLALGNFRTARAELASATRLRAGDDGIRRDALVADRALTLDPMAAGIGGAERAARTRQILLLTLDALAQCNGWPPPPALALRDSAGRVLAERNGSLRGTDVVDAAGDLAIALWKTRIPSCAADTSVARAGLAAVLAKMAQ